MLACEPMQLLISNNQQRSIMVSCQQDGLTSTQCAATPFSQIYVPGF